MSNWTLFSNHGHVLICLARDSEARLRDVAADVGITERAVQKIVRDLQDGGMVSVTKNGRRNSYRIHNRKPLRHDLESHCTLDDLINIINKESGPGRIFIPEEIKSEPQVLLATEKPVIHKPDTHKKNVENQTKPISSPLSSEPEPTRRKEEKPQPKTTSQTKVGADKPGVPESTERQQGSLF